MVQSSFESENSFCSDNQEKTEEKKTWQKFKIKPKNSVMSVICMPVYTFFGVYVNPLKTDTTLIAVFNSR